MDSDSDISDNFSDQVDVSNKRCLSRRDVAEIFGVHPQTITNWIDRGLLSGIDVYGRTFVDIRSVERLQSEFSDVVDMEKKVEAYRIELERLEEKYEQACEDLRHTIELYDYALRYKDTVRVLFVKAYRALYRGDDEPTLGIVNSFLSGESPKDIAAQQGVSVGKVCNAIKRGVKRLAYIREYKAMADKNRWLKHENKMLKRQNKLLEFKLLKKGRLNTFTQEVTEDILSIRIESLNLSNHVHNVLARMNINTLGALVELERDEVLSMHSLGLKSVSELDALLNSKGLYWGMRSGDSSDIK